MPGVRPRTGDSIEKALRILKKKLDREGIMKVVKKKRHYKKPSEEKREKSKNALKHKRRMR